MTKLSGALYPRGYLVACGTSHLVKEQGHRDVDRLADLLFTGKVNTQGFSYYREAFPIAMKFFGDFNGFVVTQKNNPFLYGYNYEFLLDTLKFILTGCRKVSIHNWKPLLAEWAEPHSDHKQRASSDQLVDAFKALRTCHGADVVAKWCSYPNGFEDMVMTMWLMFGSTFQADSTQSEADRIKKFNQLFA